MDLALNLGLGRSGDVAEPIPAPPVFIHYNETSYDGTTVINRGSGGTTFDLPDGDHSLTTVNGLTSALLDAGRMRNGGVDIGSGFDMFFTIETASDVSSKVFLIDARTCGDNRNVRLMIENERFVASNNYQVDDITPDIISDIVVEPAKVYAIWFRSDGAKSSLMVKSLTAEDYKFNALEVSAMYWCRIGARCTNTFEAVNTIICEVRLYLKNTDHDNTLMSPSVAKGIVDELVGKWLPVVTYKGIPVTMNGELITHNNQG